MPISETTQSCTDTFTIRVDSQDGYWPKKIFFDRNGDGSGAQYNTVDVDYMDFNVVQNNIFPSYSRSTKECDLGNSSTDVDIVTDYFIYTDKANYLNSDGSQMTTMDYIVKSVYKCCFYLMVDMYEYDTWYGDSSHSIIQHRMGDCATVFKDCFYINWSQSATQNDMIMGMHIPLSAGYFSYNDDGQIINTASLNGFSDVYNGITTIGEHRQTSAGNGLRDINFNVQSNTIPDVPYITYSVSRYKKLEDEYVDRQIVFITYRITAPSGRADSINGIYRSHILSPCYNYDENNSWITTTLEYDVSTCTLTPSSGPSVTLQFLNSGTNYLHVLPDRDTIYALDMVVIPPTITYANILARLSKIVDSSGDSHINIGDIFYDASDGQIKQRMRLAHPDPDRIYDANHVFYDTDTDKNVIALMDCDNEGNEEIRSVLPNDPDYIGVESSLTLNNHGMFKYVDANNNILYTYFKTLLICTDGVVISYTYQGANRATIIGQWPNTPSVAPRTLTYDATESQTQGITLWSDGHIYYNTNFPAAPGSQQPSYQRMLLFAYTDSGNNRQINGYTYNVITDVATIIVNGVTYTLESDGLDSQIDYYERQTEYSMFEGRPETGNALAPSSATDSDVNKIYCPAEGHPYVLYAMGNYGGHVIGWQSLNGEQLSSGPEVSTNIACCSTITPLVEYGYKRPFYYYVIKNNSYTYNNSGGVISLFPQINTYGLKSCATQGTSLRNYLRNGHLPRKRSIFGEAPSSDVMDDAIQSVYIALLKISDDYLIHDSEGNVLGLPEDLSCGDIIYGGDGLDDYMQNGFIEDGSVYIFIYARPTVDIISVSSSEQYGQYNVYSGTVGSSATRITYELIDLDDDERYTSRHDVQYQEYLKAPLFSVVTSGRNGLNLGAVQYNDELIASFTYAGSRPFSYITQNSYINANGFVDTWGGYYSASATDYSDGIVYYNVVSSQDQTLHLNSYFFTKQCNIELFQYERQRENNDIVLINKPFSFHYIFRDFSGGGVGSDVLKYASSNINRVTRWLPQGVCAKDFMGGRCMMIDGKKDNTIMFNETNVDDLGDMQITLAFTFVDTGIAIQVITFSLNVLSTTIEAALTLGNTEVEIQSIQSGGPSLRGTIYKDHGVFYINNLQVKLNGVYNDVYGIIRLIRMDSMYDSSLYASKIAGYTFSNFGIPNSPSYNKIRICCGEYSGKNIASSIVNGWTMIHTVTPPYNTTGTDGCGTGDEDYIAKVWPYNLYADGQYYAETMRIKIFGYTPNSDPSDISSYWGNTRDDYIEQNTFLCFTVKSSNSSSTGIIGVSNTYQVKLKFYDIVAHHFTANTSDVLNMPSYYRMEQPLQGKAPYYVETPWYITEPTSGTNEINYISTYHPETLVSYIDFDENTYEVVLKNIFGDVRVETTWRYGVYNSYFTANDSSNNVIYYYQTSTPITVDSNMWNGSGYAAGFGGYQGDAFPSWQGVEDNRTFDELAERYDVSTSPYSGMVPSFEFNTGTDELMMFYAGYNVSNPSDTHLYNAAPTYRRNSNDTDHTLGEPIEFMFGNIDRTGTDMAKSEEVYLRQSSRYAHNGRIMDNIQTYCNNGLYTQYAFTVLGNGGGRYLQITTVYTNERQFSVHIENFGTIYFKYTNNSAEDVLCDFKDYLSYSYYGEGLNFYRARLDDISNLRLMVYYFTDTDGTTKTRYEIGPLPAIIGHTVLCKWNHIGNEYYYYDSINGTQNFILDRRYVDSMTSSSGLNLILNYRTDTTSNQNYIFKAYKGFNSSTLQSTGKITVPYSY